MAHKPQMVVDLAVTYKDAMAPVKFHRMVGVDYMGANVNEGGSHSTYLWFKHGPLTEQG